MNLLVMPLGRVSGRDRVVSEPILDLDLDVGFYSVWPHRGCLSV